MKKIIPITIFTYIALLSFQANAQYVNGYTKNDGTYVGGYYRSAPDGNPYNNYSYGK